MLLYLDQVRSVGPGSRTGQRRGFGLNENLAREALELHTLGADGGYDQAGVAELATSPRRSTCALCSRPSCATTSGLDRAALDARVFPGSAGDAPVLQGLV